MTDLVDTTEMYLKAVIELEEEGVTPLRARISERLEHTGPTVSQTVARMQRDGLLVVSDDRHLELTQRGRLRATRVMRKHRLAERLLNDMIGLDWEHVHEEACRWEHVMSEEVELRLLEILDHPTRSPYGNAIPGLDELGDPPTVATEAPVNLVDFLNRNGPSAKATILWIGEPLQVSPTHLGCLREAGIFPGATGTFSAHGQTISALIDGADGAVDLTADITPHLFVTA